MLAVNVAPWHAGERTARAHMHFGNIPSRDLIVEPIMPKQHRIFYHDVAFVPVTTLDTLGRPWASLLTGSTGEVGFMESLSPGTLEIHAGIVEGDPILDNVQTSDDDSLIAGVGVMFHNRRRNKFAGRIKAAKRSENSLNLSLEVNEALGNCPKYINIRQLDPIPDIHPRVVHRETEFAADARLPDDVTSFITSADTVFLGTNFVASPSEAQTTPSLVGMNHRGGRTGFVRVRADGRTLVLPDYSGNRFMQSVGNMERTRRAALTFVDWVSGTVLLLTGDAENHYGAAAQRLMRGVPLVTTLAPTGLVFIADALRVRQRPGTTPERSPYSPPIRLLVEEEGTSRVALEDTRATLMRMRLRAPSLAEIVFRTSAPVIIAPGQAAVLDVSPLLGPRGYQHMTAAGAEARINDDGTRTWTISSAVAGEPTDEFTLTIREKPGGAATGRLFALLRAAAARQPDVLDDAMPLNISLPLLGIAGEFVLPKRPTGLLLVAGGIGVTPFLAMLRAIASASEPGEGVWDVILLVSTREPRLMDELVREAVGSSPPPHLQLAVHLFHTGSLADATPAPSPGRKFVGARITSDALHGLEITGRETLVCGPKPFEDSAIAMLSEVGVDVAAIRRENFDY